MAGTLAGLILDLDGLAIDSESTYRAAWRAAAAEMGYRYSDADWAGLLGLSGPDVLAGLANLAGDGFDQARFRQLSGEIWLAQVETDGIAVKPGLPELLEVAQAAGIPYCIATNSRAAAARRSLAYAGLAETFPLLVAVDQVARGKPAPDVYLAAAGRLGLPASACLALEDSPVGVAAAVAAGIRCWLVPSSYPVDALAGRQAERVLSDLREAADFISAARSLPL
ncbi:hypothetical protein BJL95_11355 [Methylomonas sp. LWB]|uniref:HAD family hydrolase n=1 Tax=unclassified Methylomonas TaxID=2608980 RepID=UPI0008DA9354|nr:HAD family phosphatase [Methylomonas sp. LWB]OHX36358.1 hypothetical protein BJL95_11355 [Methylomonas sp. LWB]